MFESGGGGSAEPIGSAELAALVGRLAGSSTDADDAERVDRIRLLEQLKAAAAAAQARLTAAFAASQRDKQRAAGVPEQRIGQGVAAQVALARRESPARAARYTGWAGVLVAELPATFAALQRGDTTEWRAMLVARETIWLSRQDRAAVDAALAGRLADLGDRQVEQETKKLAYRLDPHGFLARARAAERDRRVSLRPAPDTMSRLTALLPAGQGVAAYAALARTADTARSAGDPRGRGQVMADTLVERVTGQASAAGVAVEIELVMTDRTLLRPDTDTASGRHHSATTEPLTGASGRHHSATTEPSTGGVDDAATADPATGVREDRDGHDAEAADSASGVVDDAAVHEPPTGVVDDAGTPEPAVSVVDDAGPDEPGYLVGYGPIPAGLSRDLARGSDRASVWVRRLYTDPDSGQLAGMDATRRCFDGQVRRAIILSDQVCRTPWCGAPIRHADHPRPVAEGGETSLDNGQGLCEACNYAKLATGWTTTAGPGGARASVITTTPTGHTYTSRPPHLPGAPPARAGPGPPAGPPPPPAVHDHAA